MAMHGEFCFSEDAPRNAISNSRATPEFSRALPAPGFRRTEFAPLQSPRALSRLGVSSLWRRARHLPRSDQPLQPLARSARARARDSARPNSLEMSAAADAYCAGMVLLNLRRRNSIAQSAAMVR